MDIGIAIPTGWIVWVRYDRIRLGEVVKIRFIIWQVFSDLGRIGGQIHDLKIL